MRVHSSLRQHDLTLLLQILILVPLCPRSCHPDRYRPLSTGNASLNCWQRVNPSSRNQSIPSLNLARATSISLLNQRRRGVHYLRRQTPEEDLERCQTLRTPQDVPRKRRPRNPHLQLCNLLPLLRDDCFDRYCLQRRLWIERVRVGFVLPRKWSRMSDGDFREWTENDQGLQVR